MLCYLPFSASVSNSEDNPPLHTVTLSQEASPRTCEYDENPSVERSHSIPRADRECLDAGVGGLCPGVTGLNPAGDMRVRDRAVDTGVYTRGSVSKRGRRPHTLSARLPIGYKSTQVGRGSVQAPFLVSVGGRSVGTPAGQPRDNAARSDDDSRHVQDIITTTEYLCREIAPGSTPPGTTRLAQPASRKLRGKATGKRAPSEVLLDDDDSHIRKVIFDIEYLCKRIHARAPTREEITLMWDAACETEMSLFSEAKAIESVGGFEFPPERHA